MSYAIPCNDLDFWGSSVVKERFSTVVAHRLSECVPPHTAVAIAKSGARIGRLVALCDEGYENYYCSRVLLPDLSILG